MYRESLNNPSLLSIGKGRWMGLVTEVYTNLSSREQLLFFTRRASDKRSFKTKTGLVCTTHHLALLS